MNFQVLLPARTDEESISNHYDITLLLYVQDVCLSQDKLISGTIFTIRCFIVDFEKEQNCDQFRYLLSSQFSFSGVYVRTRNMKYSRKI